MTASCGPTLLDRIKAVILKEPDLCAQAIADRCGCSRSTVSMARGQLELRKWRWTRKQHVAGPPELGKDIPHCSCGLSDEERAQGHCHGHATSAVDFMGRRGEPQAAALGW